MADDKELLEAKKQLSSIFTEGLLVYRGGTPGTWTNLSSSTACLISISAKAATREVLSSAWLLLLNCTAAYTVTSQSC